MDKRKPKPKRPTRRPDIVTITDPYRLGLVASGHLVVGTDPDVVRTVAAALLELQANGTGSAGAQTMRGGA